MEISTEKFEELINLIEDLVINKIRLEKVNNEYQDKELNQILNQEILTTSCIQDVVKKITMVPINLVFPKITKLATDLNASVGRNIEIEFIEEQTEVDNSILNHIEAVISYFIKVLYENGFVKTQVDGVIGISACSDFNNAVIKIETDCFGLDIKALPQKSFESSLREIENIIGNIGGDLELSYEENNFTLIKINIPISSTITQAMIVTINDQNYAIPNSYIDTIINKNVVTIKKHSNNELILYREHAMTLIRVANRLGIALEENNANCIVIVKVGERKAALLVDTILDQTDLVIKAKPSAIKDVKEFKGTTILSDGMVTLILDIPALLY